LPVCRRGIPACQRREGTIWRAAGSAFSVIIVAFYRVCRLLARGAGGEAGFAYIDSFQSFAETFRAS